MRSRAGTAVPGGCDCCRRGCGQRHRSRDVKKRSLGIAFCRRRADRPTPQYLPKLAGAGERAARAIACKAAVDTIRRRNALSTLRSTTYCRTDVPGRGGFGDGGRGITPLRTSRRGRAIHRIVSARRDGTASAPRPRPNPAGRRRVPKGRPRCTPCERPEAREQEPSHRSSAHRSVRRRTDRCHGWLSQDPRCTPTFAALARSHRLCQLRGGDRPAWTRRCPTIFMSFHDFTCPTWRSPTLQV